MDPQAKRLPSGLHATDRTNLPLPLLSEGLDPSGRGTDKVAMSCHVAVSHSLTEALPPPATARTVPWKEQKWKDQWSAPQSCFHANFLR